MECFIPKQDVVDSINYFKELPLDTDDNLFLYLMAKQAGISMTFPVTFMTSKLSEQQKKDYLQSIWMLAGLFDSTEFAEKNSLIFPNNFSRISFYQPGTEYQSVVGRIKDTIQKKNLVVPLYDDNESVLKLRRNYQEVLEENYLHGNKISLKHLTAWVFRFTKFEFDSSPNEKQFTKVLEKHIRKMFRITKKDFLWLFDDDLSFNRIEPADSGITGAELRSQFEFSAKKIPEISEIANPSDGQISFVSKDVTDQYLSLNGDNPSDNDIVSTLLDKKQIVLTGVPGVGKSRYTNLLKENTMFKGRTEVVQFHANYSYEDFIGSETLVSVDGATQVRTKKGVFLEFIEKIKADNNSDNKYLFIIDELNRGNIAEIFGETILTLDRDYTVRLTKDIDGVSSLKIPDNLYIVGTMNTSDRNIAFLDLAIRRRFGFVNLYPNYDFLSEAVKFGDIDLGNVLKVINQRILETLGDPELLLGQSYFIPSKDANDDYNWSVESFKNQFNFVLLPTLREYSFNDSNAINAIIGENLADSLQDVDEFKEAFIAEFLI
ncbi:McrB family protein [Enterococcus thailandicus]|uniref:McrB family protein n=1 Tax=Enterococcus thailandicus TaxID=417368 RepID=UPI0022E08CEE|nr:AAA family ATPase [Enterococcus thailandicus]